MLTGLWASLGYMIPAFFHLSMRSLYLGMSLSGTVKIIGLLSVSVSLRRILWFISRRSGSLISLSFGKTCGNSAPKSGISVGVVAAERRTEPPFLHWRVNPVPGNWIWAL